MSHTSWERFLRATLLIPAKGPTKACTGQRKRQKARNLKMPAIRVGTSRSIKITNPETLGEATIVVEKVASVRKTMILSQLLLRILGHEIDNPKNLLL